MAIDPVIFNAVLALVLVQFVGTFVLIALAANVDGAYAPTSKALSPWRRLVLRLKGVDVREVQLAEMDPADLLGIPMPVAYSGGVAVEGDPDFIEWEFDENGEPYTIASQDLTDYYVEDDGKCYPMYVDMYVDNSVLPDHVGEFSEPDSLVHYCKKCHAPVRVDGDYVSRPLNLL